jgi:hypothetical protein
MPPKGKDGGYAVGYRRPPRHTQFKKGETGNPKGRPRGSASIALLLRRALADKVLVNEHGKSRRITKLEAIFKQLVNRAADEKVMQDLCARIRGFSGDEETETDEG